MVHDYNFYGFKIKREDNVASLEDMVADKLIKIILQHHNTEVHLDEDGNINTFADKSTTTVQKQSRFFILNGFYKRVLDYMGVSETPEEFSDEVIDQVNVKLAQARFPMEIIKEAPNGDITLIQDPRAVVEPQIHLIMEYTEPEDEISRKLSKLTSDLTKTEVKVGRMTEPVEEVVAKENKEDSNED